MSVLSHYVYIWSGSPDIIIRVRAMKKGIQCWAWENFHLLYSPGFISNESLFIHGYWDADRAQTWHSVKRSRELEPQHSSSEITETSLSPLKL